MIRKFIRVTTRTFFATTFALCLLPATTFAETITPALIAACTEGRHSLKARAKRIENLGFSRIKPRSKMWVQGQIAHLSMSILETGGGDIRTDYQNYRKEADAGDLFLTDIEEYAFADPENTIHISLVAVYDDDPGCSIAISSSVTNIEIPLRSSDTHTAAAGTYTNYHISDPRYAMASTFASPWDKWIKGRRLVSAFFIVSQ